MGQICRKSGKNNGKIFFWKMGGAYNIGSKSLKLVSDLVSLRNCVENVVSALNTKASGGFAPSDPHQGLCPWTPPGPLKWAPGPQAARLEHVARFNCWHFAKGSTQPSPGTLKQSYTTGPVIWVMIDSPIDFPLGQVRVNRQTNKTTKHCT